MPPGAGTERAAWASVAADVARCAQELRDRERRATATAARLAPMRLATTTPLLVALLVFGGCGNGDPDAGASTQLSVRASSSESAERPPWMSRVARSVDEQPVVFPVPDMRRGGTLLAARSFHEGAPAFLVLAERDNWVRVRLPTPPNGDTAWLPRDRVRLRDNPYSVVVDTRARRLVARFEGRAFVSTKVAVGAATTPTPHGSFYVTNKVTLTNPESWYGPYALGLSAHSEVLDSFNGQQPQIGMHGTDHPELIGQAVSNGCIRMPNRVVRRLFARLPEGTPVTIT
jgi:lipoprotein-anchoring transpeptidase ErfK/SrfK